MSKLKHGAAEVKLGGKSYTLVPNLEAYEVVLDYEYKVNDSLTLKGFPAIGHGLRNLDIRLMERLVAAAGGIDSDSLRADIFDYGTANLVVELDVLTGALLDPNQKGESKEEPKEGE